jgi:hypothetical protein
MSRIGPIRRLQPGLPNYPTPTINCQLPTANRKRQTANGKPQTPSRFAQIDIVPEPVRRDRPGRRDH